MKKRILSLCICTLLIFTNMALAQDINAEKIDFIKSVLDISRANVTKDNDSSYIEVAYKEKMLTGDKNLFNGKDSLTKEQAITMIIRAFGLEGEAKNSTDESLLKDIKDNTSISAWAKPYIICAVKNGIVSSNEELKPTSILKKAESDKLLADIKKVFDEKFLREGLTANEMLDLANKKLLEYKTYKSSSDMITKSKAKIAEESQDMTMNMKVEMSVKNPDTVYMKTTMTADDLGDKPIVTESYVDKNVVYTKVDGQEKWTKMDMSGVMDQMESLMGTNNASSNTGMSKEMLEMFGMYSKYEKDEVIDGKTNYVINMNIDNDTYKDKMKQFMQEYTKSIMQTLSSGEAINEEEMKAALSVFDTMDVNISYKIYIDKDSKDYNKLNLVETVKMQMPENMGNTEATVNGDFKYYDFDKEITLPTIKDSDVIEFDINDMKTSVQSTK